MSTQTPPRSRNPKRQQRKYTGSGSHPNHSNFLTTPPSSPQAFSPGEPLTEASSNGPKKNTRSSKKTGEYNNKAAGFNNKASENPAVTSHHRHTSSQPNINSPAQRKDSPHYAGPTFHASPAPSALPIPSFFSKSVPDSSGLAPNLESDNDSGESEGPDATPSKPKYVEVTKPIFAGASTEGSQEESPLAFLFKAALDARQKSQQASFDAVHLRSSPDTNTRNGVCKPESAGNGIFPLELEDSDRNTTTLSPSFATSYKDRMNALKSTSLPSQPLADPDEDRRKANAQAVKHLLLNPRPQRPSSAAPQPQSRPPVLPRACSQNPNHTGSGPPTPAPFNSPNGRYHSPGAPHFRSNYHTTHSPSGGDPDRLHTPLSTLRHGYAPMEVSSRTNPVSRYHSKHSVDQLTYYESTSTSRLTSSSSSPTRRPTIPQPAPDTRSFDTRKMEEDLKRILKINGTNGIRSDEVQSSLA